jgi:phosphonate transport system substrate-binding protein
LAAPVLSGLRYQGRPVYYSDVIVRRERSYQSFGDLRGAAWSYNDPDSHSGYGITRYTLVRLGEIRGYFGQVIRSGSHQASIRLVAEGLVDASAIDSQVLAVELRSHPELAARLKTIDSFGPSTIQPIVVATSLPESLKTEIKLVILEMHTDPVGSRMLENSLVERFADVDDSSYADIRAMLEACREAGFMTLG